MVKWSEDAKKEIKEKKEKMNDVKDLSSDDETIIPAEKKSNKGRKPKEKLEPEEIAVKLDILFAGIASILKTAEYKFKPTDYMEEAKAIVRLSEKVPYITTAIMIFDPIIVVVGLYRKVAIFIPKKKKAEEKPEGEQVAEPYTPRIR